MITRSQPILTFTAKDSAQRINDITIKQHPSTLILNIHCPNQMARGLKDGLPLLRESSIPLLAVATLFYIVLYSVTLCYIVTRQAQIRVRKMAGLKERLPLFGSASVVSLLTVVSGTVGGGGGYGSSMVTPMLEQEIASSLSAGFTLGSRKILPLEIVLQMHTHYHYNIPILVHKSPA